ncbi:MAG: type II toxin-antitoxin system death-on-curing family toxin [Candidatus Heimdallarchaeota archaeon]|nr:type II toxin-antitoxin system death-on-curing family toxin [Candidatus Heimdallarchaeota archaeon]
MGKHSTNSQTCEYIDYNTAVYIYNWIKTYYASTGEDVSDWGILDDDKLRASLDKPQESYFNMDSYLSIAAKAAAYLYWPNAWHVFNDANKRTSVSIMLSFLYINGCTIITSQDEIVDLALKIADGTTCPEITEVIAWFEDKVKC